MTPFTKFFTYLYVFTVILPIDKCLAVLSGKMVKTTRLFDKSTQTTQLTDELAISEDTVTMKLLNTVLRKENPAVSFVDKVGMAYRSRTLCGTNKDPRDHKSMSVIQFSNTFKPENIQNGCLWSFSLIIQHNLTVKAAAMAVIDFKSVLGALKERGFEDSIEITALNYSGYPKKTNKIRCRDSRGVAGAGPTAVAAVNAKSAINVSDGFGYQCLSKTIHVNSKDHILSVFPSYHIAYTLAFEWNVSISIRGNGRRAEFSFMEGQEVVSTCPDPKPTTKSMGDAMDSVNPKSFLGSCTLTQTFNVILRAPANAPIWGKKMEARNSVHFPLSGIFTNSDDTPPDDPQAATKNKKSRIKTYKGTTTYSAGTKGDLMVVGIRIPTSNDKCGDDIQLQIFSSPTLYNITRPLPKESPEVQFNKDVQDGILSIAPKAVKITQDKSYLRVILRDGQSQDCVPKKDATATIQVMSTMYGSKVETNGNVDHDPKNDSKSKPSLLSLGPLLFTILLLSST